MMSVSREFHDDNIWHLIIAFHINSSPNKAFWNIRKHVCAKFTIIPMKELFSREMKGAVFLVDQVVAFKRRMMDLKPPNGIRKTF